MAQRGAALLQAGLIRKANALTPQDEPPHCLVLEPVLHHHGKNSFTPRRMAIQLATLAKPSNASVNVAAASNRCFQYPRAPPPTFNRLLFADQLGGSILNSAYTMAISPSSGNEHLPLNAAPTNASSNLRPSAFVIDVAPSARNILTVPSASRRNRPTNLPVAGCNSSVSSRSLSTDVAVCNPDWMADLSGEPASIL